MSTILIVLLVALGLFLIMGLLLSRGQGGWRPQARDVASPSPNADGDAVRAAGNTARPDPLNTREQNEVPERELR